MVFIFGGEGCDGCKLNTQKKFDLVSQSAITLETKLPLTKDEEAFDVDVTPKTSHLNAVKRIFKYLKGKPNLGLWYPRESPLDLEAFSDSDYGGSNLDRKSTTGGCQFLGQRLHSWQSQETDYVATSPIEAEYNPVYHSKTKHIEIRHHFIRDCYEKKLISVEKIHTDLNVADLLTKPFDGPRFNYLVVSIECMVASTREDGSLEIKCKHDTKVSFTPSMAKFWSTIFALFKALKWWDWDQFGSKIATYALRSDYPLESL
ncbi:hypothetical protein Tco_0265298 [Tanacetum coccineum]